jgi:hypothetical protein
MKHYVPPKVQILKRRERRRRRTRRRRRRYKENSFITWEWPSSFLREQGCLGKCAQLVYKGDPKGKALVPPPLLMFTHKPVLQCLEEEGF